MLRASPRHDSAAAEAVFRARLAELGATLPDAELWSRAQIPRHTSKTIDASERMSGGGAQAAEHR